MKATFETLTSLLVEWLDLQPLKCEDHNRLWRKLRLDWNYHSNHIEGNTLTYGETEILLIHGQATGDHGLRDYMEMQAHDVAIDHMKALVTEERPLTEGDIRDFNRILIKESFWKDAITADGQPSRIEILPGEYKKQPNNVRTAGGDIFRFADPADVPIQMGELVAWLREALEQKELHPIEIASKLHHDFVLIHPFGDGNGRTARILVNYVLMRSGYLPLVVPTQQKDRYLASLRRADAGELDALTDYLATCLEASMNRGIAAAKGENIEEDDDLLKEIELFKRRQKGEEREVIKKSASSIRDLYLKSIKPLLIEWTDTISKLDSLFASKAVSKKMVDASGDTLSADNDLWANSTFTLEIRKLYQTYSLNGFKGSAPEPFDLRCRISFEFHPFHYVLSHGENQNEKRLYGHPIIETERRLLCKEALRQAFAEIKKQSGED
ncbi:MAG: Fic family protein [Akkermansiaceae bacterium]|nr:Fic family protein [Akkermansiaceae bacterium]